MQSAQSAQSAQWDLFCRVIDNHGDIGVCWRLAAELAARGQRVRLWIDDAAALAWMAPGGAAGVSVLAWPVDPGAAWSETPPQRVVEAFGCDLPAACLMRMAAMAQPPVWINLEYLSAEGFVERSHGLPSPQSSGPGAGLRKWFFYPGFTPRTGGLIREADLFERRQAFDAGTRFPRFGVALNEGERVVSLFCYEQPALGALLAQLAEAPTLLLTAPGPATRQVLELLGSGLRRGRLRAVALPWLTQPTYDELLWACDLNFVRGEDSFVRAQWAGKPFVWQPYPQPDRAHLRKLDAFLDLFLASTPVGSTPVASTPVAATPPSADPSVDPSADPSVHLPLRRLAFAWAGADVSWPGLPPASAWRRACEAWRDAQQTQPDLCTRLIRFAAAAG